MPSLDSFASSDTWKLLPLYQSVISHQYLVGTVTLPVHAWCNVFDLPDLQMLYSTNGKIKAVSLPPDLFHSLPTLQNLKFLQLFPMLLCFSSDLKSFTVTLHSRQPNCVQTPRPTLCWIPAYGSSGFSKSSFPATLLQNSILHVYSGQENWNLRRTSINFSNWVCRFIYKTNPPLLWDRWMGTALRNSSKKIEASWSKCLHEIKWYFGIQFCLLYWKLWPAKKIIWQKSFTPFTCYFSIISSLLHNQKIFCILFSHCIGDTTLQIGAIYEIWTIDK